jgi:ABC-2 type transport system ATP-binding protein
VGVAAVEVSDLVMRYGGRAAVDGLSLEVETGTITAILGPNGAGKTTTIETCEGYRRPHTGAVRVLGLDPIAQHAQLAPRLGVMLQAGGAWSGVRVREMLEYVAALHARPLPVEDLMDRLGLHACGRTPYRRLSGGEKQRLALATAIVGRPELVFLDEPTAGLDPHARRATWELVEELRDAGVTVVLTTHYLEEAERLAGFVYVLDRGRVVTSGSPTALVAAHSRDTIRFRAKPDLDLTGLVARLPVEFTVTEGPPGRYRVLGEVSPHILAAVTAWCAELDVMPEDLAVGRHTLEDVFLDLTGRELRP